MNQKLVTICTLALVVLLRAAGGAWAIECKGSESPESCFTRGTDGLPEQEEQKKALIRTEAKEEGNQAKEALQLLPTGVETGGTALESNTKNFLPLIAMSGLLGESQKDEAKGTYTFDLNFLIPGLAKDKNAQLKAVANSQPEVSKALAAKLPEDSRDATVEKLQKGLGDLDDYLLSFSYSPMGRRIGRGFEQYRNRFEALVWGARTGFLQLPEGQGDRELGEKVRRVRSRLLKEKKITPQTDLFTLSFDDLEDIDSAAASILKQATEAATDQEAQRLAFDRKVIADARLELFGALVDNQPQLNISAQQRYRDPVVGGDETSLKVTYVWARANLNRALRDDHCHAALDKPDPDKIDPGKRISCLEQYTQFVKDNEKEIKDGTRFSFSGEYDDIGGERIDRPDVGVTAITLEGAKKVILSAGYTRLFPALGGEAQPLRLDLVASYEDVSDDPARQDRGKATLTVTRKVGNLSIPFGVVYANHGEFLGEVDKQLSAHVGLKFDLFGSKPSDENK